MNTIEARELSALENVVVIDVREPFEFVGGHAPAARNLPLGELVERAHELPRDVPVYVICESGGRSSQATQWLESQGVQAVNVTGGTASWRSSGLPITTGA